MSGCKLARLARRWVHPAGWQGTSQAALHLGAQALGCWANLHRQAVDVSSCSLPDVLNDSSHPALQHLPAAVRMSERKSSFNCRPRIRSGMPRLPARAAVVRSGEGLPTKRMHISVVTMPMCASHALPCQCVCSTAHAAGLRDKRWACRQCAQARLLAGRRAP